MQKFLLSETPTASHRIEISTDGVKLIQQTQFALSNDDTSMLEWFLRTVKDDKTIRHTYTDGEWDFEHEPASAGTQARCVTITRRATGRQITLGLSTAYKLLDALSGNTERLIEEE